MPQTCLLTNALLHPVLLRVLFEVNQMRLNRWVLSDVYQHRVYHSSRDDVENNGNTTRSCRRPCVTTRHSQCSPLSVGTRAPMPWCNLKKTVDDLHEYPKCATKTH